MRAPALTRPVPTRLVVRAATRLQSATSGDEGMTTAEYAIGTVGACGFAGVLVALLKSEAVQQALKAIVMRALSLGGL